MSDYLTTYISTVIDLIQLDFFLYAFFGFVILAAVCLIRSIIWGR